jgi:hypothetical protein
MWNDCVGICETIVGGLLLVQLQKALGTAISRLGVKAIS